MRYVRVATIFNNINLKLYDNYENAIIHTFSIIYIYSYTTGAKDNRQIQPTSYEKTSTALYIEI